MSAAAFAADIAKALKGEKVHDVQLMDFALMKERGWTWQELIDTPLWVILSISFTNGRITAYEHLQSLKKGEAKK